MSAPDNVFLALLCALLVVEFNGIVNKRRNDTLSEMAWWLRGHVPALFAGLMVLVVWLPFHFLFGGH